ncbi:MAG: FG-GAP repeat domain-containing protein, partial [Bacteroidia bacterium]
MKQILISILLICYGTFSYGQFPSNSFGPKVDFSIGSNPQGLAMADLNNDGKLDVLAANITTGFVSIRLNTSNSGVINSSSFNSLITLTGYTSNPQQIFPSDLNHDGKIDLVVGYSSGTYFSIFLNNYDSGV